MGRRRAAAFTGDRHRSHRRRTDRSPDRRAAARRGHSVPDQAEQNKPADQLDARVARTLAALFNPHLYPDTQPHIQISQEELDYLAGASRQRVNRALRVLAGAGLIKVDYGLVTVLDLAGLQRYGS